MFSPIGSTLSSEVIEVFASYERRQQLPLDPDHLFKIQQGYVRTLIWTAEDSLRSLGIWGPGDIVGHLNPSDRCALECLTDVKVSRIPARCWHLELPQLLQRLAETEALLEIMHSSCTRERLYQFLLWLSQKFGQTIEQGKLIDLTLSHQDLAEILGCTRVTVTRLIGQLEHEGLIERDQRRFILLKSSAELPNLWIRPRCQEG